MIGTGVIDAARELEGFDFTSARRWHVLVLNEGRPAARVDLASPGRVAGTALIEAALLQHADMEVARAGLVDHLEKRLGGRPRPRQHLDVSVVVCTHRRSHYLPD